MRGAGSALPADARVGAAAPEAEAPGAAVVAAALAAGAPGRAAGARGEQRVHPDKQIATSQARVTAPL